VPLFDGVHRRRLHKIEPRSSGRLGGEKSVREISAFGPWPTSWAPGSVAEGPYRLLEDGNYRASPRRRLLDHVRKRLCITAPTERNECHNSHSSA
jgi:hypothetical protein